MVKNRFFAKRSTESLKKVLNYPKLVWEGPTVAHVPGFWPLVQVVLAQNGLRAQPEFSVKMGFCSEIWTFSGFLGCLFWKSKTLKKIEYRVWGVFRGPWRPERPFLGLKRYLASKCKNRLKSLKSLKSCFRLKNGLYGRQDPRNTPQTLYSKFLWGLGLSTKIAQKSWKRPYFATEAHFN